MALDGKSNFFYITKSLVTREIATKYRGSTVGAAWIFLQPILMLVIYTFVFGSILQAKWGVKSTSHGEYALILFAGLIIFNFVSECLSKAPSVIISNTNYVKKVIFPLQLLPLVIVVSAFINMVIAIGVWILFYILLVGLPPLTVLFLPAILIPIALLTYGVTSFLAAVGVYFRDVNQFLGVFLTGLMFISPIFYPIQVLPKDIASYIYLNPLTIPVDQLRSALYWGVAPNPESYFIYLFASILLAFLGHKFFLKTKVGFSDVI
ncbi:ABC transporter permease [Chromobacterium sp. IIBBL 290-4]|uniref:ABC transporter permease n=1 Tax=Chromobacterium sp. IIBBL 290-4 TaxID=2953890 RepID=UPI0020B86F41|nr:ABC transporter permease [Chromobacterium sp. IIBBL 290-4]UTH76568.1 ABC transporter permease [Chromobacterium sp. IIBBL 290-4]